ncbi:MAG TPA: hypothetical protein VKT24_06460 [Rhizomicrobium sp.]|nr:hypothetical protein [Rhizomicrobium sp.]
MKLLGTTALAFLALGTFAYAAEDPFADLYANTLVYTSPKKVTTKVLVQKDGSWTSTSSDGKNAHGAWATLGDFVCVYDATMPKTKPDCSKIVAHKVGDKWTEPGAKKGTVDQVTIVAGR